MKAPLTIKHIAKKIIQAKKPYKDSLSLSIDLGTDDYLRELVLHKQDDETHIKKLTPSERELCRVRYNSEKRILVDFDGNPVSTLNKHTKNFKNSSSFVYSMSGDLFLFEHKRTKINEFLVHGSILDDRPVKMAGIMGLYNGKILSISPSSGHYKPTYFDLYFFIQDLQRTMPGLLSKHTKIEFPEGKMSSIELFIAAIRTTSPKELDREQILSDRIEQRNDELKRLKLISFYSFIENNKPLEAAEILLNNRDKIEIDIFDRIKVGMIHKLVKDLTAFPEIKENVLSLLDENDLKSFREIDLIDQRSSSRSSKTTSYDKTDSDNEEDRDYSLSIESDLTQKNELESILEHRTDTDQTDIDSDPSLSKKRTHVQVTQIFEQLPEVKQIKKGLTRCLTEEIDKTERNTHKRRRTPSKTSMHKS